MKFNVIRSLIILFMIISSGFVEAAKASKATLALAKISLKSKTSTKKHSAGRKNSVHAHSKISTIRIKAKKATETTPYEYMKGSIMFVLEIISALEIENISVYAKKALQFKNFSEACYNGFTYFSNLLGGVKNVDLEKKSAKIAEDLNKFSHELKDALIWVNGRGPETEKLYKNKSLVDTCKSLKQTSLIFRDALTQSMGMYVGPLAVSRTIMETNTNILKLNQALDAPNIGDVICAGLSAVGHAKDINRILCYKYVTDDYFTKTTPADKAKASNEILAKISLDHSKLIKGRTTEGIKSLATLLMMETSNESYAKVNYIKSLECEYVIVPEQNQSTMTKVLTMISKILEIVTEGSSLIMDCLKPAYEVVVDHIEAKKQAAKIKADAEKVAEIERKEAQIAEGKAKEFALANMGTEILENEKQKVNQEMVAFESCSEFVPDETLNAMMQATKAAMAEFDNIKGEDAEYRLNPENPSTPAEEAMIAAKTGMKKVGDLVNKAGTQLWDAAKNEAKEMIENEIKEATTNPKAYVIKVAKERALFIAAPQAYVAGAVITYGAKTIIRAVGVQTDSIKDRFLSETMKKDRPIACAAIEGAYDKMKEHLGDKAVTVIVALGKTVVENKTGIKMNLISKRSKALKFKTKSAMARIKANNAFISPRVTFYIKKKFANIISNKYTEYFTQKLRKEDLDLGKKITGQIITLLKPYIIKAICRGIEYFVQIFFGIGSIRMAFSIIEVAKILYDVYHATHDDIGFVERWSSLGRALGRGIKLVTDGPSTCSPSAGGKRRLRLLKKLRKHK